MGFYMQKAKELQDMLEQEQRRSAELVRQRQSICTNQLPWPMRPWGSRGTFERQELRMADMKAEMAQMQASVNAANDLNRAAKGVAVMHKMRNKSIFSTNEEAKKGLEESLRHTMAQLNTSRDDLGQLQNVMKSKTDELAQIQNANLEHVKKLRKTDLRAKLNENRVEDIKRDLIHKKEIIEEKNQRIHELESNVEIKVEQDVGLMPWATYRHIVECTWASQLSTGLSTVSAPPGSTIVLSSKQVYDGQVVNVPGNTTLIAPAGVSHAMTIPSHSIMEFQLEEECSVTLPGATSVILPTTGPDKFTIVIPPRTRIAPPLEKVEFKDDELANLIYWDKLFFAPPGANSTATCVKGSIIITPKEARTKLMLPSKCELIFSLGQRRYIEVPGHTKILTPSGVDHPALLPPNALIDLPKTSLLHQGYQNTDFISSNQESQEMYLTLPPQAVVKLPDFSGPYNITLPSGASVETPEDCDPTEDIGKGEKVCNRDGVPFTLKCPGGSLITTAESLDDSPAAVAKRMVMSGTDCASVALGGMDPKFAAAVMNCGIIDARRVAKVFHNAREQAAYQVLRRLTPKLQKQVMDGLPGTMLGAILSQASSLDRSELMAAAKISPSKTLQVSAHAYNFGSVKTLLTQQDFMPWKTTSELGALDTLTATRLLATTTSTRAAAILSNMSSSNFAKSVDHMEALYDIADKMQVLGVSTKDHDIVMYRHLESLAMAETEQELSERCLKHFEHCRDAFGICLTLSQQSRQTGSNEQGNTEERSSCMLTLNSEDAELDAAVNGNQRPSVAELVGAVPPPLEAPKASPRGPRNAPPEVPSGGEKYQPDTSSAAGQEVPADDVGPNPTTSLVATSDVDASAAIEAENGAVEEDTASVPPPAPAEPDEADTVPAQTDEADTMPAKPDEADTVPAKPDEADTVPAQPDEADTVLAKPDEANTVPAEPDEADTVPAQTDEADTLPAKPDEADTVPAKPDEADTVPAQPDEADTVLAKPDEANTVPAEPDEADTVPAQPDEANTVPAQPGEGDIVPVDPDKLTSCRPILACSEMAVNELQQRIWREQLADESLEVVLSTEDVQIGSQGSRLGHSLQVGLSIHMKASELIAIQDVAAEQQRLIIKGTVMMVPVMGVEEMEGKAVAYVSHILKRTASEFILGGFPKPRQNNVPKVIEVLQLTAAALRFAYLRSARHAATLPSEELPKIEEMESQAEPQPESENKWPGMDDLEVMSKRIDEIMRQRRKHVKRMLAKKAIINKALGELKAYSKPPVLLIRVFSALFVLMGHTNLKAFLSESLSGFPQDPFKKIRKAKTSLWEFVRANIELSPRHPHNLLNLLNQFQADAKDGAGEPATDPRKQFRIDAVQKLLEGMELSTVEYASKIGGMLYQWIRLSIIQSKMEVLLTKTVSRQNKRRKLTKMRKAAFLIAKKEDNEALEDPVLDGYAD
ncbi:hypothetical protein CYMTET_56548 [Cymbomonas tetramitiformis]|uniref:Uncharacterized protein n=1 Tax=Cymbomonas tetramitiformis TaxID=36881 RepID=A0AAE0BAN7_9CHLO|nr:hypothetical protein CYMTET_56548 [Cymbomonas tetramitiformis]